MSVHIAKTLLPMALCCGIGTPALAATPSNAEVRGMIRNLCGAEFAQKSDQELSKMADVIISRTLAISAKTLDGMVAEYEKDMQYDLVRRAHCKAVVARALKQQGAEAGPSQQPESGSGRDSSGQAFKALAGAVLAYHQARNGQPVPAQSIQRESASGRTAPSVQPNQSVRRNVMPVPECVSLESEPRPAGLPGKSYYLKNTCNFPIAVTYCSMSERDAGYETFVSQADAGRQIECPNMFTKDQLIKPQSRRPLSRGMHTGSSRISLYRYACPSDYHWVEADTGNYTRVLLNQKYSCEPGDWSHF